jgi:hypothetical protein
MTLSKKIKQLRIATAHKIDYEDRFSCLKFPCKILPNLPLPKGGDRGFPLWKRGIKGDFMMILLIY